MKQHHLISALSGVALAMAALAAPAENNGTWYVDEDDNVVLNFPGSRDKYISGSSAARPETSEMGHTGTWYVDEDDKVVLNFPGSRDKYLSSRKATRSETPVLKHTETWYADEDDNIVLNFPGSRDRYFPM